MDLQKVHQRQGGPRMRYSSDRLIRRQFEFLRRQFLQDGELPFADVLSRDTAQQALDTIEKAWNESIYTPLVTLWVFLGQVLRTCFKIIYSVRRAALTSAQSSQCIRLPRCFLAGLRSPWTFDGAGSSRRTCARRSIALVV